MSTKRLAIWLLALLASLSAIAGASIWADSAVRDNGDRCPQGRMPFSCLTWVTVDRYERQLRADLPIGTPRQQVEDYLRREDIAYLEEAPLPSGSRQLRIDRSWKFLIGGSVGLEIRIVFSPNGEVAEIRYHRLMNTP